MKNLATAILLFCISFSGYSQHPKDGIYTYKIGFEEWDGKSLSATCTVRIKGDSIQIINNGEGNFGVAKGVILDQGIIMKHEKTGQWIIAHDPNDIYLEEIGGCTSGPTIISFKKKKWYTC